MLWQPKSEEVIAESFRRAMAASENARRAQSKLLLDMYRGDWDDQLDSRIDDAFVTEAGRDKAKAHRNTSYNVLHWICGKLGAIYDVSPIRTLGEETPEHYLEMVVASGMDMALGEACRLGVCVGQVFVRPVAMDGGGLRFDILTPEVVEVEVHPDDPTHAAELIYEEWSTEAQGMARKRYIYWDAERHLVFDGSWNRVVVEGNEEGRNPYGMIPWVTFHARWPVLAFWHDLRGEALRQATLNAAVSLTDLGVLFQECSYKQLGLTGRPGKDWPARQRREPGAPIILGSGTASVLDMTAPFGPLMDAIERRLGMVGTMEGLNPEAIKGTLSGDSGYALRLKQQGLEQAWRAGRQVYSEWERRLYVATARVWNVHRLGPLFPENVEVAVEWADVGPDAQPQELTEIWALRHEKGFCTHVEAIMGARPGLSEARAREVAAEVAAERRASSPIPSVPPGQSAAAAAMAKAREAR